MPVDVGDAWTGQVQVRDAAGALADATAVTLALTLPDGTTAAVATVRASLGTYTATYPVTLSGLHTAVWTATGVNASTYVDTFDGIAPTTALVSLDEIRRHMGWGTPTTPAQRDRDEDARALAVTASELVETFCGRSFRPVTVTATAPGGGPGLLLHTLPVASVTSVVEDGATLDASLYRVSDAGVLYRSWGRWGRLVTVVYRAGTASPPQPVRLAVLRAIEHHWRDARTAPHPLNQGGYDSDEPATSERWALPYSVQSLLDGYRMPGIA